MPLAGAALALGTQCRMSLPHHRADFSVSPGECRPLVEFIGPWWDARVHSNDESGSLLEHALIGTERSGLYFVRRS
jgi:hypothetical protein